MGSRGAYAGQPYTFRCAKCKSTLYRHLYGENAGLRYCTTGKTRGQKSEGLNVHHWGDMAYEYECLDCGHTGWSRHPDVARLYELKEKANDEG